MSEPTSAEPETGPVRLASQPVLVCGVRSALWLPADGAPETLTLSQAQARALAAPPLVCHRGNTAQRLRLQELRAYDVLELYAFARPAHACLPTPAGLAEALGMAKPRSPADEALTLRDAAGALLQAIAADTDPTLAPLAWQMARGGWIWGPMVLERTGLPSGNLSGRARHAMQAWERRAPWEERSPDGAPGTDPIDPADTRRRLIELLGPNAEQRPSQADYADAVTAAFQPREFEDQPHLVLAEAGTGIGKTLGYLAPASLWAEVNGAPVWVSTYTRNLQQQIDRELDRLFPLPADKRARVVVRKGRENYLCLLNYEEATGTLFAQGPDAIGLGLMARWIGATRDGDMVGGDLPAWLIDLAGPRLTIGLADRRGECIYAACPHYRRCFIEASVRAARRADIVIANHALVMAQAALGGLDDGFLPSRYVFDEGHHVFDAADSAFAAELTGREASELRRWMLGAEGSSGSRARGLRRRIEDLLPGEQEAAELLDGTLHAARALPGDGWLQRLTDDQSHGPAEAFLAKVRQQVRARAPSTSGPFSLECNARPPVEGLLEAARDLASALEKIRQPLAKLRQILLHRLDDEADDLDTSTRQRIESIARTLTRRGEHQVAAWSDMLTSLQEEPVEQYVDWFQLDRVGGQERDVGMHRHWLDPAIPFAKAVVESSHGAVITSATLRDSSGNDETDWLAAETRVGASHLAVHPIRAAMTSPFDYAENTRILLVNDVRKTDADQVAAAYRVLFQASHGGALGIFTAIHRLRAVYQRLAGPLEASGIPLLAQHVDKLDTASLVDIFRAEEDACLLGTDAVRDGVDVPGRSLRLIVFDRLPWPRPDILHKARRKAFGGPRYDDMIARLRLRQGFGRLIRREGDAGVFVLLDSALPSRLATAFPDGAVVSRVGLAEAAEMVERFLAAKGVISPGSG
ncbi:MAG: ATP-dependent DNA helicase [Alphaproteobacteria bacterium]|nr:ATP-dependent DNA helicase [Alphaproteobacteria bacterium]MCB9930410.1 ATP-dependent DNA helicase [Alphaproteobacteria bacterium]